MQEEVALILVRLRALLDILREGIAEIAGYEPEVGDSGPNPRWRACLRQNGYNYTEAQNILLAFAEQTLRSDNCPEIFLS